MHNDGVVYFPFRGNPNHGLLVQNHEYTDDVLLFPDGTTNWNQEKTNKSLNAHGVGIIELARRKRDGRDWKKGDWYVVRPSQYARRITGQTPMWISGPAVGDPRLVTSADPNGDCVLGTLNNCAMGFTPWGTYLACEENFNGYFRKNGTPTALEARYGINAAGFGYLWHTTDKRFRVDEEPNEPNRFGWVVEIDPFDPNSTPRKRTALGRLKHEGAWVQEARNDILINTRGAADLAGATQMDRPEWIDTFPETLTAIATLTNNTRRATGTNPPTDAPNPRPANNYGHVIRWFYGRDFTEPTFGWDIFALAGDPANPAHGSTIIGDKYGSPDGLYVAPSGRIWIQTDVSGSTINAGAYAGFGNNQMLCADPVTRETRRFLTGPNVCEITGVFVTPDESTMFVGIQHPGEAPTGTNDPANPKRFSSWPDGPTGGRPRSACIVITKDDGGAIGS